MFRIKTITLILTIFYSISLKAQNDSIIDNVIAVIGSQVVLKSDVEEQLMQMKARGLYGQGNERCQVFEQLLFQKLLVTQAILDSVEVTEDQVDSEIDRRLKGFIREIGGEQQLEDYFGKSILEIKLDFKPIVREQLLAQKMQQEITGDVKITPSEVKTFFKSIPPDSLPIVNATYEIAQIVLEPKITKEERDQVKKKLENLRERILKGESFSTLAILYSDDKASARNGGELGFINKGDLVKEFAAVAFNLNEGEISDIVETEFGYHIIQLIEKRGSQVNVRHILMIPKVSPEAKLQAKQKLDSIAQLIRLDSLTFAEAAMRFSEDENTKKNGGLMVNPYTGTSKFEVQQIDPATNYALRGLKVGEISNPFEAQNEKGKTVYKIIYLKSETKAHTINLQDDYQKVQDMALADKKQRVVKEWVLKKQKETYMKIDDNYKKCKFNYQGWVK